MTEQQASLLAFIRTFWAAHGYSPSYAEMAEALSLRSRSNIHVLIGALEERGKVRRIPGRKRSIEVCSC